MKHLIKYLLVALLLLSNAAFAQRQNVYSDKILKQPNYDKQIIHFGFVVAGNSARFNIKPIENFNTIDSVVSIVPRNTSGFSLGIISNLRVWKYFDLRFIPTLSFVNRDIEYTLNVPSSATPVKFTKSVESTFVEFPIYLKFKSKRINNYRVYVFGGPKYLIDLATRKPDRNAKDKSPLQLANQDFGYEIGFGFDFYLEYIKFSPEVKMFTGMRNLVKYDGSVFSTSMQSMTSKILTFSFMFE